MMTKNEALALPVTVDLLTAARALGISRSEAYILARADRFPVAVYRVGVRYRVTRSVLLDFLGLSIDQPGDQPATR